MCTLTWTCFCVCSVYVCVCLFGCVHRELLELCQIDVYMRIIIWLLSLTLDCNTFNEAVNMHGVKKVMSIFPFDWVKNRFGPYRFQATSIKFPPTMKCSHAGGMVNILHQMSKEMPSNSKRKLFFGWFMFDTDSNKTNVKNSTSFEHTSSTWLKVRGF